MRRKLAAILAADIAGYTRLMGADEAGTLTALRQLRSELFGPTVAGHRGKVVKSMGDGWLVEFASAVDAVNSALQVQERLAEHATIKLRIGVHIGDIVHESEDIYGDGVNVAARLQEVAEPGGVAISDSTYGSLDGTLAPSFDDTGLHLLKNIERPVHIWMRAPRAQPSRAAVSDASTGGDDSGFPTLAIVPIVTSDERVEVLELADALTSDLATYLGSSAWLRATIAARPDVHDYVTRATLRSRADRLRLEIRLVSSSGVQTWTGKYDGDLTDSFDWQDRVAEEAAANIFAVILDAEKQKFSTKSSEEMTATECMLSGILEYSAVSPEALRRSLESFRLAIEKDPTLGFAYAQAVRSIVSAKSAGYSDAIAEYLPHYEEWFDKAESICETGPAFELILAWAKLHRDRDEAMFRRKIEEGLRRAPFDVEVLTYCGWNYVWIGEPERAIDCLRKAGRLGRISPFSVVISTGTALAYVQSGRDEAAIDHARNALATTSDYPTPYRILSAAYAHLGRRDEAAASLAQVLRFVPGDSISATRERSAFADTPGVRRYLEGLRLAGLPE